MAIQWIFFDTGCTLVNEDLAWLVRCREQAADPEAKKMGVTALDIYRGVMEASRRWLPQFRTVIDRYGFSRAAPYRSEYETLYPGAAPILQALSRRYFLGIIANQAAGLRDRLRAYGIGEWLSVVASSWEAGVQKPDPALFRLALRQAGCAPEDAVMVGDRLDNDIVPAKALGMGTVWVRQGFGALQTPRDAGSTPDHTVDSLNGLIPLFLPDGARAGFG